MLSKLFETIENVHEEGFQYIEIHPSFDVSINSINENTTVPDHTHEQDVFNYVFEGQFKVNISGDEHIYQKGDWIFIPADTVHSVETKSHVKLLELWKK